MKRFAGFDPGTQKFAFVVVDYNTNWKKEAKELLQDLLQITEQVVRGKVDKEYSQQIANKLHNFSVISLVDYKNIDIGKGKKTSVDLAGAVNTVLHHVKYLQPDYVLVEKQPPINHTTVFIEDRIRSFFSPIDLKLAEKYNLTIPERYMCEVVTLGAMLKNNISFNGMTLRKYMIKYSPYKARKEHTKNNFLYYLMKYQYDIPPREELYDISDAFAMIYCYIFKNEKVTR